jgi:DNA helicase HerA-like ATPase
MEELEIAGQIIGGQVADIILREKSGKKIELGDLLVVEEKDGNSIILHVYDMAYGSQIPQTTRELVAGLRLEGYGPSLDFLEPQLRNYLMVRVKAIAFVSKNGVRIPKVLPGFFSSVRFANKDDLSFLVRPSNPVYLGKVRSGSKILECDAFLDGVEMFTHHVLIPATTGRGKSNLVKVMLWSIAGQRKFGILVLDPHDEYYGRSGKGLKDHPDAKDSVRYFTVNPPAGASTLVISLRSLKPEHLEGLVNFSDQQLQAVRLYYGQFGDNWIENIVRGTPVQGVRDSTLSVLQRIMRVNLSIYVEEGQLVCKNRVFSDTAGDATISTIINSLEEGKVVIVDTSKISDEAELLIGSAIACEIIDQHQAAKAEGKLDEKKVVSVIVEEAPRVLSAQKLAESGNNVYSRIAREGRKFKVGLVAITQLTSVIPREVLTNMNTKIILGNEMATERHAVMESAAQDLSDDDRTIASLDKGEAIISSIFTKFAIPVQIPLFEEYAQFTKKPGERMIFTG